MTEHTGPVTISEVPRDTIPTLLAITHPVLNPIGTLTRTVQVALEIEASIFAMLPHLTLISAKVVVIANDHDLGPYPANLTPIARAMATAISAIGTIVAHPCVHTTVSVEAREAVSEVVALRG